MLAAHAAGVNAPAICRRHGISERTLARWSREGPGGPADDPVCPPGPPHGGRTLCQDALCIVLAMLSVPERRRVLRVVEGRLHLTRGRGSALLLGRHPHELRKMPSTILGVVVPRPCLDAPLATHLDPAQWLVVRGPLGHFQFLQFQPDSILTALVHCYCTDFIGLGLALETVERLTAEGIRVWRGDPAATLRHQLNLFDTGVLCHWPTDVGSTGRRPSERQSARAPTHPRATGARGTPARAPR